MSYSKFGISLKLTDLENSDNVVRAYSYNVHNNQPIIAVSDEVDEIDEYLGISKDFVFETIYTHGLHQILNNLLHMN